MGLTPGPPYDISQDFLDTLTAATLDPTAGAISGTIAAVSALSAMKCPDVPPANTPTSQNADLAADTFRSVYVALRSHGVWCWLAIMAAAGCATFVLVSEVVTAIVLMGIKSMGVQFLQDGLALIDQFRQTLDPQVRQVSVSVLNELLGTDFDKFSVTMKPGLTGHIEGAEQVGALFHNQLVQNFTLGAATTTDYGARAAHQLTGNIVNFGVATALLGLTGELAHMGLMKDFRLIGEQVTSGLGLSRMQRQAIMPALRTLVVQPYQWWLNRQYHPTQFKANEIVNPYASTVMDAGVIATSLDLEGYDADKIGELVKLHQKRLTVDDVEILHRWGYWDDAATHKYIVDLGWPEELADTVGRIPELRRIDGRVSRFVDTLESWVDQGHLALEDAMALMKNIGITEDELAIIRATMMAKTKTPHKSLTLTEVENAFNEGLFTQDDVVARLSQAGYQGDDLNILTTLVLIKFAQQVEAKKVAQYLYDRKVETAKKKGLPVPPLPKILTV